MAFDAESAVEPMDYDFSKYGGSAGTIPEPSNDQISAYQRALIRIWRPAAEAQAAAATMTEAERLQAAIAESEKEGQDAQQIAEYIQELAAVCSNQPSVEDITRLPYRVRVAFQAWLLGELGPKAATSDSTS